MAVWLGRNALVSINVVVPRRVRLVLEGVTVCGRLQNSANEAIRRQPDEIAENLGIISLDHHLLTTNTYKR